MYAFIVLNEWMDWVKSRNCEFSDFLKEVGTPCIAFVDSRCTDYLGCTGFFITVPKGWSVRYNRDFLGATFELRISEVPVEINPV
jgi:hypothetical protein